MVGLLKTLPEGQQCPLAATPHLIGYNYAGFGARRPSAFSNFYISYCSHLVFKLGGFDLKVIRPARFKPLFGPATELRGVEVVEGSSDIDESPSGENSPERKSAQVSKASTAFPKLHARVYLSSAARRSVCAAALREPEGEWIYQGLSRPYSLAVPALVNSGAVAGC